MAGRTKQAIQGAASVPAHRSGSFSPMERFSDSEASSFVFTPELLRALQSREGEVFRMTEPHFTAGPEVWTMVFDPPLPPDQIADVRVHPNPTGGYWSHDGTAARGWGASPLDAVLRLVGNGRVPGCVAVVAPDGTRYDLDGRFRVVGVGVMLLDGTCLSARLEPPIHLAWPGSVTWEFPLNIFRGGR